jgi:hypothetical protein
VLAPGPIKQRLAGTHPSRHERSWDGFGIGRNGEAIVLRPDNTSDFEALRSRQGQAEAILIAYDIMEADGQDVRPEPLEERRKPLNKLLSRSNKAMRDGIQLSEAITGIGPPFFAMRAGWTLEVSKRIHQDGVKLIRGSGGNARRRYSARVRCRASDRARWIAPISRGADAGSAHD